MANEILSQINDIIRKVLDNDDIVIQETTTAKEVPDWDSLSHVQIVAAIEKHFKITFTSKEIHSFKNVGEMCAAVAAKRAK